MAPPAREPWRLLTTWDGEPGWNMALDEALLQGRAARPTLRLYTWRPAALSLGYFQRWSDVPAAAAAPAVVRRLTGGGAIHHDRELTFSIAAPADHPLYRGELANSYGRVHALVARTLERYGVQPEPRGARELTSDRPETGMCFHASSPLDLVWNDRKGVGSAQRRTGGRVLHHGSIKLGTTPLEGSIATLEDTAPGLAPEAFAEVLLAHFAEALGARLEPQEPAAEELRQAAERAAHFTSRAFVRRR